jgi:hypothetical protein
MVTARSNFGVHSAKKLDEGSWTEDLGTEAKTALSWRAQAKQQQRQQQEAKDGATTNRSTIQSQPTTLRSVVYW